MKHLFFIGNKRCGTTLMVNLLNLHPNVFISHESDVMRVLWWMYKTASAPPKYAWDGGLGVSITLKECGRILEKYATLIDKNPSHYIPAAFWCVTEYLMMNGSEIQRKYDKTDLRAIGDKKPVQYCDPKFRSFVKTHFPDAHYLHMVRDPRAVVASMVAAAKRAIDAGDTRGLPVYWRAAPENILSRWVAHEKWALQMAKDYPVHRVRLEDMCCHPITNVYDIFRFVGLEETLTDDFTRETAGEIARRVEIDPNSKYRPYDIELSPEAIVIAKEYGYVT